MKTYTKPAPTLEARAYSMQRNEYGISCAPYVSYFGLLRDAERDHAWETFGAPAVPKYFESGVRTFQAAFAEFSDLQHPSSQEAEKQLIFMLESLIQARQLLKEMATESK